MIGLWSAAHGEALRYFVLFTGALIESFVLNDVCDEYFYGKTESSDAAQVDLFFAQSRSVDSRADLTLRRFCRSTKNSLADRGTVRSKSSWRVTPSK